MATSRLGQVSLSSSLALHLKPQASGGAESQNGIIRSWNFSGYLGDGRDEQDALRTCLSGEGRHPLHVPSNTTSFASPST